jgi:hypothetical protein
MKKILVISILVALTLGTGTHNHGVIIAPESGTIDQTGTDELEGN